MPVNHLDIANQFSQHQTVTDISSLGNGLINDTFLVKTNTTAFVLQCINRQVFPEAGLIMENLSQLIRHISFKKANEIKLTLPALIKTHDGLNVFRDSQHNCWRALQFIEHSESRETISHKPEAEQTGFALAHFHRLFSDLNPVLLHDTLPGFHITPHYLDQYDDVASQSAITSQDDAFGFCKQFINNFADKVDVLEKAKQDGRLSERIIHGDPKFNNFLFANNTHTIISLIDLDTVKPGLVHYDIGDCLRSCCHIKESNSFDVALSEVILTSYLQEAGHFFTREDYDYLYAAIELIPFELGLRFFTDYLNGDQYFKVDQTEQNLFRARNQFELCTDIAGKRSSIEKLIRRLQKKLASIQHNFQK